MVTTRRGQEKKPPGQPEPQSAKPAAKPGAAPAAKARTGGAAGASATRVLKKYPNRRLYDTQTSGYITLADVKAMVLEGKPFEVRDAKTSEDLTRSILLQIILEEESGGVPMFSTQTLSQIIRLYGHAMQGMMGAYLEKNMQTFVDMQQRFTEQSRGLYDPASFTPELWTQFMSGQAPMMQGLMGNYLEQSKNLFVQMQEQMNTQTGKLFPGFPAAGFPPPPSKK
jgi:polyhydroxyalkanoate synthesis repressor PhaR